MASMSSETGKVQARFLLLAVGLLAVLCLVVIAARANGLSKIPLDPAVYARSLFGPENPPPSVVRNNRPLIGILSQPGVGWFPKNAPTAGASYIAASYVKFVEAGGARAVPIIYNAPKEELIKTFNAINGLLFPGGGADLNNTEFYNVSESLFKMALASNDAGDYFPVHGTCLGLELLAIIVSQQQSVLEKFPQFLTPVTLEYSSKCARRRSFFRWMAPDLSKRMEKEKLAMMNHEFGVSTKQFAGNSTKLSEFFRLLTTTRDSEGKEYVSTIQGRKYPVTATQWHPEKNAFEWESDAIPHGPDAIAVTQAVASYFANEARRSRHRPSSYEEEEDLLMYNYEPTFVGKNRRSSFEQVYTFYPNAKSNVERVVKSEAKAEESRRKFS